MKVVTERINLETKGNPDLIDITDEVREILSKSRLKEGNITLFVVGSTAALTTFEYENGLIRDMRELYEKIIPKKRPYAHDETWGDANGFSHLRAALQGPDITIPFDEGKLCLGRWQQVVFAEFDNGPRKRTVIVQIIGE